jgi:hypothetical protein
MRSVETNEMTTKSANVPEENLDPADIALARSKAFDADVNQPARRLKTKGGRHTISRGAAMVRWASKLAARAPS